MRAPYIREFVASLEARVQTTFCGKNLRLVKTANGGLDFVSGGGSVLFEAEDESGLIVKCYRQKDARRSELYRALQRRDVAPYACVGNYYERGLSVVSEQSVECDVLIAPRLSGVTLGERALELCRAGDTKSLCALAEEFDRLAGWLLCQDWAHGDICPENIVVTPEGVRLIDFDAAFLPELTLPRVEVGRPQYNHPLRTAAMDSKSVDDWPLAVVSLNLHALALNPTLMIDEELPLLSHCFVGPNPQIDSLRKMFAESGDARAYTLCGALCDAFPEIEMLPKIFALRRPSCAELESFSVGSRWGLMCGTEVVEPAVWDDVVRHKGEWFGALGGSLWPLE